MAMEKRSTDIFYSIPGMPTLPLFDWTLVKRWARDFLAHTLQVGLSFATRPGVCDLLIITKIPGETLL